MAKKEFTREQLEKAIDLALNRGVEAKARFEGGKEAIEIVMKMIDKTYLKDELKSDTERLNFIETLVLGLHNHYQQMLNRTADDILPEILRED